MATQDIDSKVRTTFYLLFGTIVYMVAVIMVLRVLSDFNKDVTVLFLLTLLPLLIVFLSVWGYGLKVHLPGMDIEYYPVEKVMNPPSIVGDNVTGVEAENIMDSLDIDFLNVLDKERIFQGIFTRSDAHRARLREKINTNIKNLMTKSEEVVSVMEKEKLKSIMEKIGATRHSRMPVLNNKNQVVGIIDSVDINELLSKVL